MTIATLCAEASRAAKLTQREEDLEDVTRDLTEGIADIFDAQGALFVAGLEKHKGKFSEAWHKLTCGELVPTCQLQDAENKRLKNLESHYPQVSTSSTSFPRVVSEQDEQSPVDGVWPQIWVAVTEETSTAMQEEFTTAASIALETGGEAALASMGLTVNWNLTNPAVINYLEAEAARFVTNVNDTTKERLRVLIANAAKSHASYNELATAIIDAFAHFGQGATQMHIDSRAHLIAVTELGNAYEESGMIVARELDTAGIPVKKRWNTRGDSRVSDGCQENGAAGAIPVRDEWPSAEGTYDRQRPLRFPGCRCWQTTEIDPEFRDRANAALGVR